MTTTTVWLREPDRDAWSRLAGLLDELGLHVAIDEHESLGLPLSVSLLDESGQGVDFRIDVQTAVTWTREQAARRAADGEAEGQWRE